MTVKTKKHSVKKPSWWYKVPSDPIFSEPTKIERENQRRAVKEFLEYAKTGLGIFETDENGKFFIPDDDE